MKFLIAISLLFLTAGQANSQPVKNLPLMLNAGQRRTDKRLGRLIA